MENEIPKDDLAPILPPSPQSRFRISRVMLLLLVIAVASFTVIYTFIYSSINTQVDTITHPKITVPPSKVPSGKSCGGIMGEKGAFACPSGYRCVYPTPMHPDASGTCVKQ